MSKIPVFILSGFLGSGKTTLLKRMLHECNKKNLKPAVLMNELGSTDTDGNIINEQNNEIMEKLLDGCICCSKKNEVLKCIEKLLLQKPDVLIIELTGVANPEEVVDSMTEPQLIDRLSVQKIISVLDAENILEYNSILESDRNIVETNRRQIEVADLLIINKVDLVTDGRKLKIEKIIRKHNSVSPIYYSTYSEIDLGELFADIKPYNEQKMIIKIGKEKVEHHQHTHPKQTHTHSYSRINTISLPIDFDTNTGQIEKFLKKWRPNLLRAKGFVPIKEKTYLMQTVLKRTSWESTNFSGSHYIVMIGIDLNAELIKKEWERLLIAQ
ncbi:MAG: CobW family GTP-binding protein [Anaerobacillus sp.]|uniref:CobW family GTP-binding protein n=1 Tax=Anaerobacillus sp. TaxID=1872506 RepID=UPI00391C4D42